MGTKHQMISRKFNPAPIAVGVALALASQYGAAQSSPDEVSGSQSESGMEEVIVRGIRQSLEKSADIKRNDAGVVDAITPTPFKPVFWRRHAIINAAYIG